jgi:thiol:disulfide interchange protein
MSPRVLAVLVALILLAISLGAGWRLLMAHAFMLSPWQKALRFVVGFAAGIALFMVAGAFFYVPAEAPASPSSQATEVAPVQAVAPDPVDLVWHTDFAFALETAKAESKPILVDCWASWCKPCKKLFSEVLTAHELNQKMSRFVLVKLDTMDEANEDFVETYGVGDNLPWIGFFDPQGKFLPDDVLFGDKAAGPFADKDAFGAILNRVAPDSGKSTPAPGWLTDLKAGFALAKEQNRPLLVDGWAVWCTSCLELKERTFKDPAVTQVLEGWVKVEIDMDAPENQWVWDTYAIRGLPWVVRFEPGETEKPSWMLAGFEPPDRFVARLEAESVADESVAGWLASKGLFITLLLVFLAGIAASLTPCAYPSYLLIFGFFSGSGQEKKSVWSGVLIAAVIVLGMAMSYSAAGIAAALGGGAVGRIMNNPYVMGAIALLFIGIGSSSLGVLPPMEFAGIKNALHTKQKSNLLWALIFGLVMGLVVAPCVGPILIGVLTYIAAEGDLLLGVVLMSTFAAGMGVLFFAMAIFSQAIRTKVRMGRWNEFITVFFGIIFFAAALYYLKGVIPYEKLFSIFVM